MTEQINQRNKSPVKGGVQTQIKKSKNRIEVSLEMAKGSRESVPVVVANTFHPNWSRTDGQRIFTTTPFNQLTFANESFEMTFGRKPIEVAAVWVSFGTLLLLIVGFVGELGYRSIGVFRNKKDAAAETESNVPVS